MNIKLYIKKSEICPDCGEKLIIKWSGFKCSKCPYWFCL